MSDSSPSLAKAKPKPKRPAAPPAPKTLDLVIEAINSVADRKGASVQSIKSFILTKCPEKDPTKLKSSMKKAIVKGLESGVITRPKTSADAANATGSLSGRYRVDKAKLAALEKPKAKPKPVAKPKLKQTTPKRSKKTTDVVKAKPREKKTSLKKSTKATPTKAMKKSSKSPKGLKTPQKAQKSPSKIEKKMPKPKKLALKSPKVSKSKSKAKGK